MASTQQLGTRARSAITSLSPTQGRLKRLLGLIVVGMLSMLVSAAPFGAQEDRAPVPSAAIQEHHRNQLREIYKEKYVRKESLDATQFALDQAQFAMELCGRASGASDPDERYVILLEAVDVASRAGDAGTTVQVLREIAADYATKPGKLAVNALLRAEKESKAASAFENSPVYWLEVADIALSCQDCEGADKAINRGIPAARQAKDEELKKQLDVRAEAMRCLKLWQGEARQAQSKLAKDPADCAANVALGRLLCLGQRNWTAGLPHLARGDDVRLAELAERDLARPNESSARLAIADAWWKLGDESSGLARAACWQRAASWYSEALAGLDGINLARAERRITQAKELLAPPSYGITGRAYVLDRRDFACKGELRVLQYTLVVPPIPDGMGTLQINVGNMGDDSGDKGMYFELRDASGAQVFREFSSAVNKTFRHYVRSGTKWTVILEDLDTRGNGNKGSIEAWIDP